MIGRSSADGVECADGTDGPGALPAADGGALPWVPLYHHFLRPSGGMFEGQRLYEWREVGRFRIWPDSAKRIAIGAGLRVRLNIP